LFERAESIVPVFPSTSLGFVLLLLVVHVAPVTVHVLEPAAIVQLAGEIESVPLGYASEHDAVVPVLLPEHDHVHELPPATLLVLVPVEHP
jgi:hypothetical protein